MGTDVKKWTFGGLKRTGKDGTGRFSYALLLPFDFLFPLSQADSLDHSDDDLVRVLTEATEEVAGAFKARGAVSFSLSLS